MLLLGEVEHARGLLRDLSVIFINSVYKNMIFSDENENIFLCVFFNKVM